MKMRLTNVIELAANVMVVDASLATHKTLRCI